MKTMTYEELKWPDQHPEGMCCHTVLAMATGRSIEEIIALSKTIGFAGTRMSMPCVRVACRKLDLPIKSVEIYRGWVGEGNELPADCLVFTEVDGDDVENGVPVKTSHILLRIGNTYYDPQYHGKSVHKFPLGQRITRYAEIDTFYNYETKSHCNWTVNTKPIKEIAGY